MPNIVVAGIVALLPIRIKRFIYVRVFGWSVHESARIGITLIHAESVSIGAGARIGHLNIVKGIRNFEMGDHSYVRHLNQFFAQPSPTFPDRQVTIGAGSQVMSRHFFDGSGRISIGEEVTLGGRGSQFWSHSLTTDETGTRELVGKRIVIGSGTYVGASCVLVTCDIPPDSVVGAGTVTGKSFPEPGVLISGNPGTSKSLNHRRPPNQRG